MCEIYRTSQSARNVYIEMSDDEYWGLKKLPRAKYEWAKQFKNPDFLAEAAVWTTERDFNDSASSVDFKEPWIDYASYTA